MKIKKEIGEKRMKKSITFNICKKGSGRKNSEMRHENSKNRKITRKEQNRKMY